MTFRTCAGTRMRMGIRRTRAGFPPLLKPLLQVADKDGWGQDRVVMRTRTRRRMGGDKDNNEGEGGGNGEEDKRTNNEDGRAAQKLGQTGVR